MRRALSNKWMNYSLDDDDDELGLNAGLDVKSLELIHEENGHLFISLQY